MFSMVTRAATAAVLCSIALVACNSSKTGGGAPAPDPYLAGRAVLSWGANDGGQLGDGTNAQRPTPVLVHGLDNIRAVAAGGNRSLALLTDGTVWQWGAGYTTPAQVPGLVNVKAIAAGGAHALALTSDHRVYAWGANTFGQLGDDSTTSHTNPVLVNNLTDAVSIAAGRAHSVAIRADLSVVTWGANNKGQLGDGTNLDRHTPVTVPGLQAIEVAAGADHTLAVSSNVSPNHLVVMGWGDNHDCQLKAVGSLAGPFRCDDSNTPLQVNDHASSAGSAIAGSATYSLVLSEGHVLGFGKAEGDNPLHSCWAGPPGRPFGGFGLGDVQADVVATGSGPRHSLLITDDGQVLAFGANNAGQLGNGTATGPSCLAAPAGLRGASAVAAGDFHSLAVVTGIPSVSPASPVAFPSTAVGSSKTLALTVTNTGLAPLSLYSFTASGDFQISSNQCPDFHTSLAPGTNCPLQITFTPAAAGPRTGELAIAHDGNGRKLVISLAGSGTEPMVAFDPPLLDFGPQRVGTTSQPARLVTLRNDGGADLTVTSAAASAGFNAAASPCLGSPVSAGGGTCIISVTFSPTEAKPAVGELTVSYGNGKIASMTLRGTGVAPQGTITPAMATFMPTAVGDTSLPVTFTVTSTGSLPLIMGAAAVTGDFQIATNNCNGATLSNMGDKCTIDVQFTPMTAGNRPGQLTVSTNGLPASLSTDLTGAGT